MPHGIIRSGEVHGISGDAYFFGLKRQQKEWPRCTEHKEDVV